ncbi:MAG: hypothetical protein KAT34_08275 [Candidatus Aminicenantes bacterium]|nr:hypothetical protein [Candidatus Aminicenantes bacterium]
MVHLKEEQIASMAEGNVKGPEHERMLKHLAECETCFKAYTDTLKFVEEERIGSAWWRKFRLPELHFYFPKKVLLPAAAVLIVVLLAGAYILKELRQRGILNDQVQHLTSISMQMENIGVQAFSGTKGKIMAAFRAGVFVEDLSLLIKVRGKEELTEKTRSRLIEELKILMIGSDAWFQEVAHIERKNYKSIIEHTEELLKPHPYFDLFQFGRFVEQSILATYENKRLKMDIDKYQQLVRKYKLPPGVSKRLRKFHAILEIKKIREIYIAVKEIFLFSE